MRGLCSKAGERHARKVGVFLTAKRSYDLKSRQSTMFRLQNAEESTTHEYQCRARLYARQTCPDSKIEQQYILEVVEKFTCEIYYHRCDVRCVGLSAFIAVVELAPVNQHQLYNTAIAR